ncbi:SpaA isopeptide-forming pilin-related protein (plasmid) [Carnobacterium maltaromaticum]|uniref:SpaA isopeptide-forming pilin-related protein n=1 Tax=Carnobacterium maltaromaticum TaxID=2751 RepID=UPI00344B5BC8
MNIINVRFKIKSIIIGAIILGSILVSAFLPMTAKANIIFPQTVTVEFDVNQLYTMRGTFSDGRSFESKSPPLFAVYESTRQPIFCIEPGVPINNSITPGYTSNPLPAMSIKAKYISVLWKYVGTDGDTQQVAQAMVWQEANGLTINSIARPNGVNLSNFQEIQMKINQVVADYQKKPSFSGQTVKVNLGDSVTLTDTDNVGLNRFDTLSPSSNANVDWVIKGNQLTITPKKDSNVNGFLRLFKSVDTGTPVAYRLEGQQAVMAGAIDDPNWFQINLEVIKTGEAKITKLDKGTNKPIPNTEFNVEFGGKSQTVKTDANGEAIVKGIDHDTKVKVTETFVPAPYILDKNNTKEVVIKAGKTTSVEFKNERATGKTTLTKQDDTTKTNEPLNPTYPMTGAKYGLFKEDGKLVKEFMLEKQLTATLDKLELGNYFWKETVAPIGYTLDPTEHKVELTYKDQNTPVIIKDATSSDDVIRMNLDGQKLIQNETNEIFKNGVEFTLTNKRTEETKVVTTSTLDGKKGYFLFADMAIDDYVLTETKGVEGYKDVDPIEINHSYDKESATFTFTVKDQKSGNVLTEEKITQLELSKGENVDLGTYTLKDKATPIEEPNVSMVSQANIGDDKTQTFKWGENIPLYDNLTITHENIPEGTMRGYEVILVAVYTDKDKKETEKDAWTSGIIDYKVPEKEITEKVLADYDYKQDPVGTRYYFKDLGYNKPSEDEYVLDTEHNTDGKEKSQDITPVVEIPIVDIATQAHIGDDKTQTFVWGEDVPLYDNVKIKHKNIPVGTNRAFEVIMVAVYTDEAGKETEKDAWMSGKIDYKVTDKELTEKVLADYDYKKDPKGTRYYFKELGFNKPTEKEYVQDADHNLDGKEKTQDITPIVKEPSIIEKVIEKVLPQTGEAKMIYATTLGVTFILLFFGLRYREQMQLSFRRWKRQLKK